MSTSIKLIHLTDESPTHHEFLLSLFVSTRAAEVAAWGWSKSQATEFLSSQFDIQQRSYQQQFQNLQTYMIGQANQFIGMIQLHEQADTIRIVNVIIAPSIQGIGIGTSVLRFLQNYAEQQQKAIQLSVDHTNRAKHWYSHLGFVVVSNQDWNCSMIWNPKHISSNHFIKERYEVQWSIF